MRRNLPYIIRVLASIWLGGSLLILFSFFLYSVHGGAQSDSTTSGHLEQRIKDVAARGKPIVDAIYQFKADCGLWPCSLRELIPDYLTSEQIRGWSYTWQPTNWWYLSDLGLFPENIIRYEFRGKQAGWLITDGETETWIQKRKSETSPRKLSTEVQRKFVTALKSRIRNYKHEIIHYQGLICWYYQRGEYRSASEECAKCLRRWPNHWWPNLMMAYIEKKLDQEAGADKRLATFATRKSDLGHWFFVADYYLQTGQAKKCRHAMRTGSKAPIRDVFDGRDAGELFGVSGELLAWQAAVLCYRQAWFEECLAVCDQWQAFEKEKGYLVDHSYWALRAACYLARREYEKANDAIQSMMKIYRRKGVWADHLTELEDSINRKDSQYKYDPGNCFTHFSILIEYH
jgi:hypothetical protein